MPLNYLKQFLHYCPKIVCRFLTSIRKMRHLCIRTWVSESISVFPAVSFCLCLFFVLSLADVICTCATCCVSPLSGRCILEVFDGGPVTQSGKVAASFVVELPERCDSAQMLFVHASIYSSCICLNI